VLKVKFWGVRGSIPCPGTNTVRYGGNSACLELRVGTQQRIIVIDAGTGIRDLGNDLVRQEQSNGPLQIDLFLSHTHWDHIMGFPFFTPIYLPGTKLNAYGPVSFEDAPLEDVVGGQMKYRYFPVNVGKLSSSINYIRLEENPEIDLGDGLKLATKILNHPILTLGYRFEYGGRTVCTCYDYEPFRNLCVTDPAHADYDEIRAGEQAEVADQQNRAIEQFFAGADLLIHDAQYTENEYSSKIGWGHSTYEHTLASASRSGVKRLAFFHHDPDRTDDQIDELAEVYCERGKYGDMEVFFAREGLEIELATE